jgi:flagellar hook protein FlgE
MSYYTALSGLNAAQTDLAVISNNIANVGTTGFKRSDASFGDIISSAPLQTSVIAGQGTRQRGINQEFSQGGFQTTDRSLDLAISGQGFFMTRVDSTNGQVAYTRNGGFSVNAENYVVDAGGNYLQVLPTDTSGVVTASGINATRSLQLPATSGTSSATQNVDMAVTLPTDADVPSSRSVYSASNPYVFNRFDPNSYNQSTTTTVYDSAGNAFPMTTYYVRQNEPSGTSTDTNWLAYTYIGDQQISLDTSAATQPAPLTMTFDQFGAMTVPSSSVTTGVVTPSGAVGPIGFSLTYGSTTKMTAAPFTMTSFNQDGYTAGKLDNVTINADGLVQATFSNGDTQALGKIVLATFANPEGLRQLGNGQWSSTGLSGEPIINQANSGGTGQIQSGALEQSNVDITAELVALIQAQRDFSANAKAIETSNNMTDTIINLRT